MDALVAERAAPGHTLCHQCIHRKRSTGKAFCNPFCEAYAEYAQAGPDPRMSAKTAELIQVALVKQRCHNCFRDDLEKVTQKHSEQP
ncbi:unnamed protein product, partial [Mesorhabditis spiculigera]